MMPKKTQTQSSRSLDPSAQPESAATTTTTTTTTNSPESQEKSPKLDQRDQTSEVDSDWEIVDKEGNTQSKKELDAAEAGTSKGNDEGGKKQTAKKKKKGKCKGKKDSDMVFVDPWVQPESAATTNSPESNQEKSKLDKTSEDDSDWEIVDKPGDAQSNQENSKCDNTSENESDWEVIIDEQGNTQSKKEFDAAEAGTKSNNKRGKKKRKRGKGKKDSDAEKEGASATVNGGKGEIMENSSPNGKKGLRE